MKIVLVSYALYKCQDQRFLQLFLLAPGVREGWGLVVTEANAMGTPAVEYRMPRLCDSVVADGATGKLAASGDTIGIAIGAVGLLKDQEKLRAYLVNALHNLTNFDWHITKDRVAEILCNSFASFRNAGG
jgi:glycosyltransferase involved in cell wall biosynthesis